MIAGTVLQVLPQKMNDRPPAHYCRNDLETLMASTNSEDWVKLTVMLLGPTPPGYSFVPKHKSNSYAKDTATADDNAWG
jgi:tRNA-dihydrouridine synthase 3